MTKKDQNFMYIYLCIFYHISFENVLKLFHFDLFLCENYVNLIERVVGLDKL